MTNREIALRIKCEDADTPETYDPTTGYEMRCNGYPAKQLDRLFDGGYITTGTVADNITPLDKQVHLAKAAEELSYCTVANEVPVALEPEDFDIWLLAGRRQEASLKAWFAGYMTHGINDGRRYHISGYYLWLTLETFRRLKAKYVYVDLPDKTSEPLHFHTDTGAEALVSPVITRG
jgi:hypothetical protein